jgi:hypothetical protein
MASAYTGKWAIPKEEIRAYYKLFKLRYDDYLSKAKELLSVEAFTFSIEEIDRFGVIYAGLFKEPHKVGLTYSELQDVFTVYYGEAWMYYFGGVWFYSTSLKDSAYGYPQINKSGPQAIDFICPNDYSGLIERRGNSEPLSIVIVRIRDEYIRDGLVDFKPAK